LHFAHSSSMIVTHINPTKNYQNSNFWCVFKRCKFRLWLRKDSEMPCKTPTISLIVDDRGSRFYHLWDQSLPMLLDFDLVCRAGLGCPTPHRSLGPFF
jgi:hypothetical protein